MNAVALNEERAVWTLTSLADAILRTDRGGRVDFVNPAAERLLGHASRQLVGQPAERVCPFFDDRSGEEAADPVRRCLAEARQVEGEALLALGRAGDERIVRYSASPLREPSGDLSGAVLLLRDVTHVRQLERQLSYLASHDPLTGLANRREFEHSLELSLGEVEQASRRHTVFYLDLDNFKRINDLAGHQAGDEMLKQIAGVLVSRVRASDVLGRLGGDEFGVLLRDCPFDKALGIADSIRLAVEAYRFSWQGNVFSVGVSIGVVAVRPGIDLTSVLRAADSACYAAKQKGRNRIEVLQADDAIGIAGASDAEWLHDLGEALQEDRLRLFWQPIRAVVPGAGRSLGVEVLVRMLNHDGAIVSADIFGPAAERNRLMSGIDRWVVQETLRRATQESTGSLPAYYGINLSAQSLAEPSFLTFLAKQLEAASFPASRLCFEITEAAVIANLASAQQFLFGVRRLGCRAALDDFGAGVGSFAFLRELAVDFLKIHGGLVRRAVEDPVARAMVESIHRISRALGIETIAKWVESEETLDALRRVGVDYAQGYWLGSPLPAELHGVGGE